MVNRIYLYQNASNKRKYKIFFLNYSLLFSILSVITIGYIFSQGNLLHIYGDGLSYNMPCYAYIRRWILNFFNTGRPQWYSFTIGMGNNSLETLSWTGLGDPFCLFMLISPKDKVMYMSSIILIIKMYLAGFTMGLYLMKHKISSEKHFTYNNYRLCALFAIVYLFSYLFQLVTLNSTFCTSLITFPLIIYGLENVIEHKTISKLLIFAVAFQGLYGFYFLYIELVFAIFFSVFFSVANIGQSNIKTKLSIIIKDITRVFTSVFIGLGLSAPILIPSILGLFKSSRTNFLSSKANFNFSDYIYFIKDLCSPKGLALPVIIIIIFFIYELFKKSDYKAHKLFAILLFIIYPNKLFGLIVNGGQNDRFSFVIIFFILAIVSNSNNLLISPNKVNAFFIITLINIVLVQMYSLLPSGNNNISKYGVYSDYSKYIDTTWNCDDYKQYRNDVYLENRAFINSGMYYNDYRCGSYLSTINKEMANFYKAYYLYGAMSNGNIYRGVDDRILFEDFFAIKNYYNPETKTFEVNNNYIQWGVVYDKAISTDTFNALSPIERYDSLSKYVVIENNELAKKSNYEMNIEESNYRQCDYSFEGPKENSLQSSDKDIITLAINDYSQNGEEYFLYIEKIETNLDTASIIVNEKEITEKNDIFVKFYPNEDGKIDIIVDQNVEYEFEGCKIYQYSPAKAVELLQEKTYVKMYMYTMMALTEWFKEKGKSFVFQSFMIAIG